MWSIEQLKYLRESEDSVEFKAAEQGNFSYDGGNKTQPKERRKCILGYVTALCNEGGGTLVLGMHDKYPHKVLGTQQSINAIGLLESKIYNDCGIRPNIYELYEDPENHRGRVLVIQVDGRPTGKLFRFEDVPLMRVGEELKPMSDERILQILCEHEPDFSAEFCTGLKFADLESEAIDILKKRYSEKQQNPNFRTLTNRQALSDLKLISGNRITYAALILLGKSDIIQKYLPQAMILLEYRKSVSLIPFDNRQSYCGPFYKIVDELWHDINLHNSKIDIQHNSYFDNIKYFNEEVIREAINNAVAHRDYRRNSETVIKLYPDLFVVMNAGGFPLGVSQNNLLDVQSTPRNRLLSEVLASTGIGERSGQGVDKIYRLTLSEGKEPPDYSHSDNFRVELRIDATIKDVAFAMFIESEQRDLEPDEKLSVSEVIGLDSIRRGNSEAVSRDIISRLLSRKLIEKRGKTRATHFILAKSYYEMCGENAQYTYEQEWNVEQVLPYILTHFKSFKTAKMKDFAALLEPHLTRRQVRNVIDKMIPRYLTKSGAGSATTYSLSDTFIKNSDILNKALGIGIQELLKREDISNVQNGGQNNELHADKK
jgi:ATP-dependent DNA helicase RecG